MFVKVHEIKIRDVIYIGKSRAYILEIKDVENGLLRLTFIDLTYYSKRTIKIHSMKSIESLRTYRESYIYRGTNAEGQMQMVSCDNDNIRITIDRRAIVNHSLLSIGRKLNVIFCADDDNPIFCYLPLYISEEVIRLGQPLKSRSSVLRTARISGGADILVPNDIREGDMISINTRTVCYKGRSRKF